ncbi:MAG: hypothetical protein HY597_04105 [Candidatus Omnitrophica bacterium]|nr:hypothetical protein [Candidatus Omnitrophota bacterium]
MKRGFGALLVISLMILGTGVASADMAKGGAQGDLCKICATANDDSAPYAAHAGSALVLGAANTLLGWTELFNQPAQAHKNGEHIGVGLVRGVGYTIRRTLQGVGGILTFWVPKHGGSYLHVASNCPMDMNQ